MCTMSAPVLSRGGKKDPAKGEDKKYPVIIFFFFEFEQKIFDLIVSTL